MTPSVSKPLCFLGSLLLVLPIISLGEVIPGRQQPLGCPQGLVLIAGEEKGVLEEVEFPYNDPPEAGRYYPCLDRGDLAIGVDPSSWSPKISSFFFSGGHWRVSVVADLRITSSVGFFRVALPFAREEGFTQDLELIGAGTLIQGDGSVALRGSFEVSPLLWPNDAGIKISFRGIRPGKAILSLRYNYYASGGHWEEAKRSIP